MAEVTGLVDLSGWPVGTRLILRKERPHPGAQLRTTDIDGMRITGLLTDTATGQLPDLELRHRRHALAADLPAWCARLALPTPAAHYEPKRLRLRILAVAGQIVTTARRRTPPTSTAAFGDHNTIITRG